jgi:1,4-dihydroxy-6-naphthoate synthase
MAPSTTKTRAIRLAFSPDADDLFMFWPLLAGKIDAGGLAFEHERVETERLNARAEGDDPPDVCAVSIAHMPAIASQYLLLPHGGSVGRGYGPVVVAKRPMTLAELVGRRVGVPGARTTAHLVLRLLLHAATGGAYEPVVVPIAPFAKIFEALDAGEIDAALLIHEGRLSWKDDPTLHQVVEIGEGWTALTGGLPLPLGGNAIRRDLGDEVVRRVSDACRRSIVWALAHRDEVLDAILTSGARAEAKVTRERLDRYLDMYANADSAGYSSDVVRAIEDLLRRGQAAGFLPAGAVELAP